MHCVSLLWLMVVAFCIKYADSQSTSPFDDVIVGLTLVNSETDLEISPLSIDSSNSVLIDLALYGTSPLTIRCDINKTVAASVGFVEFNIDNGRIVRTEEMEPYYLGGDTDGDANEVNTLQIIGTFNLQITVYDNVNDLLQQQLYSISVVDTSIPDGGGTLSPTITPLSIYDVANYTSDSITGSINGELKKWHKITIGFAGPSTSETNNIVNPFTDYRLDVTFTHTGTKNKYVSPGFYACRGDVANSGESSGNIWLVHFRPDAVGDWSYVASFIEGVNVSFYNQSEVIEALRLGSASPASFFDGAMGTFTIVKSDKKGRDLRSKGRLRYSPDYGHLQFLETDEYFLKAGADSPENFLAYIDFDNTPNYGGYRKDWSPHVKDYNDGDPTWSNGKGQGIIGAINYLSSKGMNVISFLTMNINGDDRNVYPYASDSNFFRIDCSKTAQWDIVFDHAERMGMFLHFKMQETENDQLLESEGEVFGSARKLYYRELIARFGHHLALNWNLGEENDNTDQQRKVFSDFIKDIDPYDHPIVVHTHLGQQDEVYGPLLGYQNFDGVSIQANPSSGFQQTLKWVNESAAAGRKWIVSYDEQAPSTDGVLPDTNDPSHNNIRQNVLWANLMAGGAGVEYYFGYSYNHSDLTAEDYRSRAIMWDQSRYALEFFSKFSFWNMTSSNQRVTNNNWCLLDPTGCDPSIALYLPSGDTLDIDLRGIQVSGTSYSIEWYDPLNGGDFLNGTIASIPLNMISTIGFAPSSSNQDWAVLLKCVDCLSTAPTATIITPIATSNPETLSPSAGVVYPSSFPSGTEVPSNTIVFPDSEPSGKPSSGGSPSNTTDIASSVFPTKILSMPPSVQSHADALFIRSETLRMLLYFYTFSCISVTLLPFI